MKKLMTLTFTVLLLFILTACGDNDQVVNNNQNQSGNDNQSVKTTPDSPEFTCAECGAYCNAYNHDSLCGLCNLPEGASTNIWNPGTNGIVNEIREMICRGTDRYHGGSAIMALPGGLDELLELYNLYLTQDEERIVEHLKKIACTPKECACPYRTQAALNSIFTDFLDMNEIRFPYINGGKPEQIAILHEGHNNKINVSYGTINGMYFTVAVHPMYNTNDSWVKDWLDSFSLIRTLGDVEIYLSREPSEPDDEFFYRGVTHASFALNVNEQYVEIYVSNPPCEIPPEEEMVGSRWDYTCNYCNNVSQGPRCYGPPVDVQAALDVIVFFEFITLI
jgi:hypothetical protein